LRTERQNWRNACYNKIQHTMQRASRWHRCHGGPYTQHNEELRCEIHNLRQRIAAVESERDAARHQLRVLESALTQAPPGQPQAAPHTETHSPFSSSLAPRRTRVRPLQLRVTATGMLLLGALASATTFLDGQRTALPGRPSGLLSSAALQDQEPDAAAPASTAQPRSQTLRTSSRRPGGGAATAPAHRQWGPPLLLPDTQARKPVIRRSGFDPVVRQQQQNLLDLGFDLGQASADGLKGPRTEQALQEFRSLYLSGSETQQALQDSELDFLIGVYADLARRDAKQFGIDRGVVAAIRLSSVRTGVEFSFLMELAAVESAFDPLAQAPGSSAAGLYQFTRDTWLNTVKTHGDKYGMGDYASQIEYTVDRRGNRRPRISDQSVYQHLLELRKNPRVAAMMAAESVKDNVTRLSSHFEHQPGRTELYLTHFLGPDGAVSFLKALNETPDTFAADIFPAAAANNQSIFHPRTCKPRTVNEVYEVFSQKFDTARYEYWDLN